MLSVQDNDQMLKNVVHIYPEDRTKTTLANLISTTEILCSLSQLIVREDFHTMYIWNNKARTCKNGKLHCYGQVLWCQVQAQVQGQESWFSLDNCFGFLVG